LETQEGKKDVFKLARDTEKKRRDLKNVRCIKGDDGKVLVEEAHVRVSWQSYFSKLSNGKRSEYSQSNEGGMRGNKTIYSTVVLVKSRLETH